MPQNETVTSRTKEPLSKTTMTLPTANDSTRQEDAHEQPISLSAMEHVNPLQNHVNVTVSSKEGVVSMSPIPNPRRTTSTRIFSNTRFDRSGSAIQDMLMAHAYAFQKGAAYGGACGPSDHLSQSQLLIDALGLTAVLPFACPSKSTDILVDRTKYYTSEDIRIWTPEWVQYIQQQQQKNQQQQVLRVDNHSSLAVPADHPFTIVAHIRRGDINPCCWEGRYLPNSHYLTLIERYLPLYGQEEERKNHLNVIIFSESQSFESFDDFRNKGYQVVLDGEPSEAWKTMMMADVLILSKSSFSLVPAVLSTQEGRKIVYTKFNHLPLQGWDNVENALNLKSKKETHKMLKKKCPGSGIICGTNK
jgi:hypothetical protein